MSKLVILITSRIEEGHHVGEAWQQAGAPGVTLVGSYGLRRLQETQKSSEVLAGMISLAQIFRETEETSVIILSVVDNDAVVDKLIEVTEHLLGSLMQPNTGVLFVLDVERTVGVRTWPD
jgi:nitrogen regulatory protein PII